MMAVQLRECTRAHQTVTRQVTTSRRADCMAWNAIPQESHFVLFLKEVKTAKSCFDRKSRFRRQHDFAPVQEDGYLNSALSSEAGVIKRSVFRGNM